MTEKKPDVLQPVDDAAKRLGKTLVRTARYGALGTLDPRDGAPSVSRVSLATAMDGSPIFLISRLSGHFTNLEADGRCSLLVGEPGKGDPLAHPRLTLIGTAAKIEPSPGAEHTFCRQRYLRRHPKAALYVDFPDFSFWRFNTSRASLNAGFGKAYSLAPGDLQTSLTGVEALPEFEESAVSHMNSDHLDAIQKYAARVGEEGSSWSLASLDPEGLDMTAGDRIARLWFDRPLASAAELRPALVALAKSDARTS